MANTNYCRFTMRNGEEFVGFKIPHINYDYAMVLLEDGNIVEIKEADVMKRRIIEVDSLTSRKMSVVNDHFEFEIRKNRLNDEGIREGWKYILAEDELWGEEVSKEYLNSMFKGYGYYVRLDTAHFQGKVTSGMGLYGVVPFSEELARAVNKGKVLGVELKKISEMPEVRQLMEVQAKQVFRLSYIGGTADKSYQELYLDGDQLVHYIRIGSGIVLSKQGIKWFKRVLRRAIKVVR